MADYYVSSVSGDNSTGASWATAKTTIAAGLALATANNDRVYVDSAHSENPGANITWDAPTASTHVSVISVDRNGSTGTGHNGYLKGALVQNGNTFGISIAPTARTQSLFIKGILIRMNSGTSANNSIKVGAGESNTVRRIEFDDCELTVQAVTGNQMIFFGSEGSFSSDYSPPIIVLKDTLVKGKDGTGTSVMTIQTCVFTATGLTIGFGGASKPGLMMDFMAATTPQVRITSSDLSGYDNASGNYFGIANLGLGYVEMEDCKLSSNSSITPTGTWKNNSASVSLINCDSGDTKTKFSYYNRLGTLLVTESIYVAAAEDMNGVDVGWHIVTTSACSESTPFILPTLRRWNDSTSSITPTFHLIHDSATNLNDRNCWAVFEYISSASFPLGTAATTRNANSFDGSASDLAASSETWTGTGGFSNPNKQKMSSTFTPAEKSFLKGTVFVGIASKTLYLVPQIYV